MTTFVVRVAVLISICASSAFAKQKEILIEVDSNAPTNKFTIWLGYIMERADYHEKHNLPLPSSGEIIPSLQEEASARNFAVRIYQNLKEKDRHLRDGYWETLAQVKAKGFMNAYVWTYLRRPDWPKNQEPKNLAAKTRT